MKNGYTFKHQGWGSCIWNIIWPILFYIGITVLVSFVASFIIAFSIGLSGTAISPVELTDKLKDNILMMNIIIQVICICLFLPFYLLSKKYFPKVKKKASFGIFWSGGLVVLGVGLLSASILSLLLKYLSVSMDFYEELEEMLMSSSLLVTFITTTVLAPLMEELMVRGLILNRLLSKTKVWVAIVISALIFGVIHMNFFQGLNAFIIGVALGYVYVKTRSLWPCIFGHFLNNFVSVIEEIWKYGTTSLYVIELVIMVVCLVVAFVFWKNKGAELEE